MLTIIGAVVGGLFRLAPEVIKFMDAKNDRKHELDMQDKAIEFQQLIGSQKVEEITVAGQQEFNVDALDALKVAIESQRLEFKPTGHKLADFFLSLVVFLNSSVRPVITYWFFGLYCVAKMAIFYSAINGGSLWYVAAQQSWTSEDMALFAGILNFWFLGRVFDKVK